MAKKKKEKEPAKKPVKLGIPYPCLVCTMAVRDGTVLSCSQERPEIWSTVQGYSEVSDASHDKRSLPGKMCPKFSEVPREAPLV